nr:hypothetical protein [uncultured bacterium]
MAIIVVLTLAHFGWKYSGSNEWEKLGEKNGVTVYAMKVRGSSVKKFRAVWKINTTLSKFATWVNDTKSTAMRRNTGLHDLRILERQGDKVIWSAYKQPIVEFLKPREFVIRTELSQNPKTKELLYTVKGFPNRIPEDDCCVRVPVMDNYWKLTPLKNGEVEVEWFCDMELGGAVPYVLQNKVMPEGMFNFARRVQKFVDQDKYKNAKVAWVLEPQPAPAVAN